MSTNDATSSVPNPNEIKPQVIFTDTTPSDFDNWHAFKDVKQSVEGKHSTLITALLPLLYWLYLLRIFLALAKDLYAYKTLVAKVSVNVMPSHQYMAELYADEKGGKVVLVSMKDVWFGDAEGAMGELEKRLKLKKVDSIKMSDEEKR